MNRNTVLPSDLPPGPERTALEKARAEYEAAVAASNPAKAVETELLRQRLEKLKLDTAHAAMRNEATAMKLAEAKRVEEERAAFRARIDVTPSDPQPRSRALLAVILAAAACYLTALAHACR